MLHRAQFPEPISRVSRSCPLHVYITNLPRPCQAHRFAIHLYSCIPFSREHHIHIYPKPWRNYLYPRLRSPSYRAALEKSAPTTHLIGPLVLHFSVPIHHRRTFRHSHESLGTCWCVRSKSESSRGRPITSDRVALVLQKTIHLFFYQPQFSKTGIS
jgi:hypothetical protein